MPRVKGGTVTRKRRKKVIKLAKGYYGSKHTLYKVANQQVMKSLMYAFRDRRQKKRDFRKLWITRINAAARMNGLSVGVLATPTRGFSTDSGRVQGLTSCCSGSGRCGAPVQRRSDGARRRGSGPEVNQ
jgi:ribosomal protein L20